MTDGPTGIQVAPIASEEDMSKLASMFQRAANAVVAASEFPAQLSILSKQVEDYKHQIDGMTSANEAMTNTINELRNHRDGAIAERNDAWSQLSERKAEIEGLTSAKASSEQVIAQLNDELDRSRKDSDEHLRAYLDTSDELTRVKVKLGKLTDLLRDEGESKPVVESTPTVEAKPQPETSLDAKTTSQNVPITNHSEGNPPPAMQANPEPKWDESRDQSRLSPGHDAPIEATKPDTLNEWEPGYHWDSQRQVYVRT